MAILNITYGGLSADYPIELDHVAGDADLKRIALEVVRSGGVPGLHLANLPANAFDGYVVDRLQNGQRLYLRPKVPFGA
jgi:hypothetical protein